MTTHVAAIRRRGSALIAFATAIATLATGALLMFPGSAGAGIVPTVLLRTASNYAVLGHSTVTNTGDSVINGSVGLYSGTSITGFPPGIVVPPATIDATSAAAQHAQSNVTTAYNDAAGRSVDRTITAELGGQLLPGGVYSAQLQHSLGLTGTLTLDGEGNSKSVFIFQTDSTLKTASSSHVRLINGAQQCNVFWQVGSSATLGTDSIFAGNILALASVTVTTGVTVYGRAFARTAAVTLDTDTFKTPTCDQNAATPTTVTPTTAANSGGGTATTTPGGGTATTVPGSATPVLPGTPPGTPGVPGVSGPPRTGGSPLPTSSFPWLTVMLAGLLGTAGLGAIIRMRLRMRLRMQMRRLHSSR